MRERVCRRFKHVLVDEYQDTNFAQGMLLRLLVDESAPELTVVGDDDQAIYRFRGASQKNLVDFQQEFPDATVVRLERNYRSGSRILKAARAVVAPCPERIDKKLTRARHEQRALLALPLRARPGPGDGRRGRAAGQPGGRARRRDLRARALGQERGGRRSARRWRSARCRSG